MPVNTPHRLYEARRSAWARLRDCFEGRDAVIAAGTAYLPALPGNPNSDYGTRGSFYNAVRRTVQGLAGLVMQRDPTFVLPPRVEPVREDSTLTGCPADELIREVLEQVVLVYGHGLLVDMSGEESGAPRPYLVQYRREDIVGWRVESRGGDDTLTMVVLHETAEERDPKDPFVLAEVEQFRVLELRPTGYTQTVWRKRQPTKEEEQRGQSEVWEPWTPPGQEEAVVTPLRRAKPLDYIPFVSIPSIVPERPPLLDLADVNLAHWRNSADYEYGLHLVALPTPYVAGQKGSGSDTSPLKIGPSVVWELEKDGKAGMLEFTGQGLSAIKEAMEDKRHQMASLGARLLEEQPKAAETATGLQMRHAGEQATLRTIARSVSQGFTRAFQIVSWWMGTDLAPADVKASVELNLDLFAVKATPEEIKALLLEYQAETISFITLYELLQKGGRRREGVTADQELAEIERTRREPEPQPDTVDDPEDPPE